MDSTSNRPDVLSEALLTTAQAARRFPSDCIGGHVHPATIYRWILSGISATDGSRIHLDAVRIGSRWLTSCEAIQRFAEQLMAVRGCGPTKSASVEPAQRNGPHQTPASAA